MVDADPPSRDNDSLGTILVVEDEYLIAADLAAQLEKTGARILGPVGRLDAALAMLGREARVDGAVLDVKLYDERVYELAEALDRRGIPFVFATAFERAELRADFRQVPHVAKPFTVRQVVEALHAVQAGARGPGPG